MDYIGWIKSYRKMQNNWIWRYKEPYDRRSAWQYILFQASYEDRKEFRNGAIIEVKRGQFITSVRELSDKWMWNKSKVTRFLDRLETEHMVKQERTKTGTLLTVVNYGFYQGGVDTNATPTSHQCGHDTDTCGTPKGTRCGHQHTHDADTDSSFFLYNKEIRNKEERNKNNICAPEPHDTGQTDDAQKYKDAALEEFYNSIWKLYPIKKGKGQVSKTQKQKLQRIGFDEIKRCVDRYLTECQKENTETQYMVNGSTFFNSRYVDYLDKNYLSEPIGNSDTKINKTDNPENHKHEEYLGEIPDISEEDYVDLGAMTREEFDEYIRVHC